VVNAFAAARLTLAFRQLFAARFPIRRMRVVDDFGGDDGGLDVDRARRRRVG
jgi:hypothetical protein